MKDFIVGWASQVQPNLRKSHVVPIILTERRNPVAIREFSSKAWFPVLVFPSCPAMICTSILDFS
jgi:hypothetical protein